MPVLSQHKSSTITKLLLMGDSGTGKTSSLLSLVKAGYKLRVWDYDNLLSPLKNLIFRECPDKIDTLQFMTFRDKIKASAAGPVTDGTPTALLEGLKAFEKWEDGTDPSKWGGDYVVVLDSLTRFCDAAYRWGEFITPSGKQGKDGRAIYGEGQRAVSHTLSLLTGETFATNVIVIAHTVMQTLSEGNVKLLPRGLGQALSPDIPTYFENWLQMENNAGTRTIRTIPSPFVDLKNALARPDFPAVLPAATGLADFFKAAKGGK